MKTKLFVLISVLTLLGTLGVQAQGTAFTYQGRLTYGVDPANGFFDITFGVWSAATGPAQVGPTLTNTAVAITNGLFTALLDFGSGVFTGPPRWLEIALRPSGAGPFQVMNPRQPLTSTPYALQAGAAALALRALTADTVAEGAITALSIAPGAVGASQLADGAAAMNLTAMGLSGVPSGGVLLSLDENLALEQAGYVKLGLGGFNDSWLERASGNAPAARYNHTVVWTGSEMIIWGGLGASSRFNSGGRYNPAANSWAATATIGAPTPRSLHTAVWTEREMIVWGGWDGTNFLNSGGRYNPVLNSWTPTAAGGPLPRIWHTAVWTGSEMIIWGGMGSSSRLHTGGRYNPVANTWAWVGGDTVLSPRDRHTAVWTGSEMIVWGGMIGDDMASHGGARYNPAAGSWTPISGNNVPEGRRNHTAVWTGSEMIVWGG